MQLTVVEVAKLFDVSENAVIRWVGDDSLPAEVVDGQFRFQRAELLEWATINKQKFSPAIYEQINGDDIESISLADAVEAGGVLSDVTGDDTRHILRNVIEGLPIPESFGIDTLLELILTRESAGSTAIGEGIAVPHPRQPVVLTVQQPLVRLCYLVQALDIPTPDGKPVDTLFLMICPTVHDHLQLLARLGAVLRNDSVRSELSSRAGVDRIVHAIRQAEFELIPSDTDVGAT